MESMRIQKNLAAGLMKEMTAEYRKKTGARIKDISEYLQQNGLNQSEKTIYPWCEGRKTPPIEAILLMGQLLDYPNLYEMAGLIPKETMEENRNEITPDTLYKAYRSRPEMQSAINYMLNLTGEEDAECENKPSENS